MKTLSATRLSLTKLAPCLKLAAVVLALTAMACGEVAAMDSVQPIEVPDVPEAVVYVESIEFRAPQAPAAVEVPEAIVYVESIEFRPRRG